MSNLTESLETLASQLQEIASRINTLDVNNACESLEAAIDQATEAFSGSWIGYHSRVYYEDLRPAPPGAHFSPEWGFMSGSSRGTRGNWVEYTQRDVYDLLKSQTTGLGLDDLIERANSAGKEIGQHQEELLSTLTAVCEGSDDEYLATLKSKTQKIRLQGAEEFVKQYQPRGQLVSRDMTAISQGLQIPPHVNLLAQVEAVKDRHRAAEALSQIASQAASHLERKRSARRDTRTLGDCVFIGHGQSPAWRDLKDFIQDRLNLPWDEFNRVPVAGFTNITRLAQMLDQAAIAFLIMTAEDELADGKFHARMNVVHEAGLFQGRLDFRRAIVLLEEGCEEFSNIQGLGQIRFPPGKISAAFEEVWQVLEREGLLSGNK